MADGQGTGDGLEYQDLKWRNVVTPDDGQQGNKGMRHIGAAFPKSRFHGSIPHKQRLAPSWADGGHQQPPSKEQLDPWRVRVSASGEVEGSLMGATMLHQRTPGQSTLPGPKVGTGPVAARVSLSLPSLGGGL